MPKRVFAKGTYDRYFRRKMMKRRGRYARGRQNFAARVKRVVLKTAETKKFQFADENVQLYHNMGYASAPPAVIGNAGSLINPFNIWAGIYKGSSSYDRIGDRIMPRGMSLKIWLSNKATRPNVLYRILVLKVPKAIAGTATAYNNVNLFDITQLGNCGNRLIMKLDQDRGIKALYDKVITNKQGWGAPTGNQFEQSKVVKLWIKSKKAKPIIFDSTAAQQIINNPLMIYIIPYDAYGTLVSDNIASCAYTGVCYYKDI